MVTRTRDGGNSFDILARGLPQEHAYDLTFHRALDINVTGERLAFASTTGSCWVTDDQGENWQAVAEHLPPIYVSASRDVGRSRAARRILPGAAAANGRPLFRRKLMNNGVKPIPDGQHTLTPHLIVKGATEAIAFYKKAFGAEEFLVMPGPDGGVMHGELKIGDSLLFMCEEYPDMGCRSPLALGGSPVTIHLYVEDADAVFNQAVAAGATVRMPLSDMFWGDRYGQVADPFGHVWSIATHKEDLTPAQIVERMQAAFAAAPGEGCAPQPAAV